MSNNNTSNLDNLMSLFQIYYEQYKIIVSRLNRIIDSIKFSHSLNDNSIDDISKIRLDVEKNLKESERVISQMNLDINLFTRRFLPCADNKILNNNKEILEICKKEIKEIRNTFQTEYDRKILRKKEEKLTIKVVDTKEFLENSKKDLDNNTNEEIILKVNRSNEKLNLIKRETIEMESRAENIKREIFKQSDQLSDIGLRTNMLNSPIDNSGNVIRRIMLRQNRNKTVIALFSFALVCMFVLTLYSKF